MRQVAGEEIVESQQDKVDLGKEDEEDKTRT